MSKRELKHPLTAEAPQRLLRAKAQLTEDELSQICAGGASAGVIIINRKKWGNLESRVSYGDLVRW